MPTILLILGWRLFFYANEGNEPIHVHCQKAEKECKYWLDRESFDINEAYSYNMRETNEKYERSSLTISNISNMNGITSKLIGKNG